MSDNVSPIKYFISGGFGGICTVLSGHPLDTIKVRLQTQPIPEPGQPPNYTGTLDCAKKTIKAEGIRGLYKGMAAPLTGVVPIFALSFFGFGLGKRMLQKTPDHKLSDPEMFLAGNFSGFCCATVMAPGERIKCLLQIQETGPKVYDGMWDCAKKLYAEGGIRSVYKGYFATLLRDVPASGAYFWAYELVMRKAAELNGREKISLWWSIFAGGCAGIANWMIGMPADVLKSRFQTAPAGTYKGLGDVLRELLKRDGPAGFYKGFTPVILRAFPANAACFLGFELAMRTLNKVAPGL